MTTYIIKTKNNVLFEGELPFLDNEQIEQFNSIQRNADNFFEVEILCRFFKSLKIGQFMVSRLEHERENNIETFEIRTNA